MSLDPYSPCPCGSGKKLKFCCQAVAGDIEKVELLLESHQKARAVQTVEALERKHPDNPWVVTARAELLMQDGIPDEAAEILEPFVEANPDHHFALVLLAVASFSADGFELAKPVIHRAFQRCLRDFPDHLADLAMGIASRMLAAGKYLSARAHLVQALRLASDEVKSQIFVRLMEFDGNERIPYPLRSVHELGETKGADEKNSDAHKAVLLSNLGCWRSAARLFSRLAEAEPENENLWYNAGLCRAWDGDESLAVEALHKAARLQHDFETAVEWETVAQLLEYGVTDDRVRFHSRQFTIDSASRLLSVLDHDERMTRITKLNGDVIDEIAGMYYVLDAPNDQDVASLTPDTVANVLAQITLFDADEYEEEEDEDEQRARVFISGREGEAFESALKTFQEAAEACDGSIEPEEDEDEPTPSIPREFSALLWRWHFPDNTPARIQRKVERDKWDHVTGTIWPDTPLAVLKGKSPRQAAQDPNLSVPLRAGLNVLDAYCDRSKYGLDVDALAASLGIEPPPEFVSDGPASLDSLTSLQLRRVRPVNLDDEQLALLLRRAVLIHHSRLLYDVLSLAVNHPKAMEHFDRQRLLLSFSDLCRDLGRHEESLRWIREGREYAKTQEDSFQSTLQWVIREVQLRLEDPSDPDIAPLLKHIGDYYLPKLPELRDSLTPMIESSGITPPWETAPSEPAASIATDDVGETVWTPGAARQEDAGAEKKLWLPGQ